MAYDLRMSKQNSFDVYVDGKLFRATDGSSGYDLHNDSDDVIELAPGQRTLIKTGVRLSMPPNLEAQVRSRSGLALKQGLAVLNAPGTIDSDYRGEIGVIIINHSPDVQVITPHQRIAQLVFARVEHPTMAPLIVERDITQRGEGGFGSTGE